ncbi:B-cell antigen receptor complex-associated protein beta chain [Ambystoma mexicanum]|uniref:B-cell antigen receptor complex-associated protein beta chain n=1 Tax=Ambystoma mexicanum TaxID=8296 RepID=UPI0037E8AA60
MAGLWGTCCAIYGKVFLLMLFTDMKPVGAELPQEGPCQQRPRFLAARKGSTVHLYCSCGLLCSSRGVKEVSWHRGTESGTLLQKLTEDPNARGSTVVTNNSSSFTLHKIQYEDNGIYYCLFQTKAGPQVPFCGTEVKVLGFGNTESIATRNTLKDAIILIQTILIVVFLAVPFLLVIEKSNKPVQIDEDHTYEGLQIEEAATYEDILAYHIGDAKWTMGEHPCQE